MAQNSSICDIFYRLVEPHAFYEYNSDLQTDIKSSPQTWILVQSDYYSQSWALLIIEKGCLKCEKKKNKKKKKTNFYTHCLLIIEKCCLNCGEKNNNNKKKMTTNFHTHWNLAKITWIYCLYRLNSWSDYCEWFNFQSQQSQIFGKNSLFATCLNT